MRCFCVSSEQHSGRTICRCRSIHFQWCQNADRGVFGQWWLGHDKRISVGTDVMPDPGIPLAVSAIPGFDLIHAARLDRFAPFPWDKYAKVKDLAKTRANSENESLNEH